MELYFTKMHGLGNDFMVVDAVRQALPEQDSPLPADSIRRLADRHFGIGFDQLLVVQPARGDADFRYRIFNADGGEVSQCGNGARCFARFVRDQGLTDKQLIRVETAAGEMTLEVQADEQVTVNMGAPRWTPSEIPFKRSREADSYLVRVGEHTWEISAVGLGNPHAVMVVEDVDQTPVASLGPLLESHPDFPERVNAGFMEVVDRGHIRLRVYERGAGETLACGSGACAAMLCARRRGLVDDQVRVSLRGGDLQIHYAGDNGVLMTGPAERVYDGRITIGGNDA